MHCESADPNAVSVSGSANDFSESPFGAYSSEFNVRASQEQPQTIWDNFAEIVITPAFPEAFRGAAGILHRLQLMRHMVQWNTESHPFIARYHRNPVTLVLQG